MRIYAAARLLTLRCLQACFRLKQCAVFFCELLLHATGGLIECCAPSHINNGKSACSKVSPVRHTVPGGSWESLPKRKVRFADKPEVKWQGERLEAPTRPVRSLFGHQPQALSRLEAATRPYQRSESFIVRFWLRKSV
jgi:hypothetical protein